MINNSSLTISAQDLVVGFNQKDLTKPFSFNLSAGEALSIVGRSGVGKTCLLNTMTGRLPALRGQIKFSGDTKPSIAILDQEFKLYVHLTVEQNVELALRKKEKPWRRFFKNYSTQQIAHKLLRDVGLSKVTDSMPNHLSGGQRQRAALAVALAVGADMLILDEPFSGLDQATRHDLQNLVVQLTKDRNLITIIVTHDLEEALYVGNYCLVLRSFDDGESVLVDISSEQQDDSRRYHWMFLKQTQVLQQILGGEANNSDSNHNWTINEMQLSELECAAQEVWVISRHLNQDAENPYLKKVVQKNLSEGKTYTYFIPEGDEDAQLNLQSILKQDECNLQVSAHDLPISDPVFAMGELVILNPNAINARVGYSYMGDENGTLLYRMHDDFLDALINRIRI